MENLTLSCIDCTVTNCNHQQKNAMKLYKEIEEN